MKTDNQIASQNLQHIKQPSLRNPTVLLMALLCSLAFSSSATIRTVTNTADSGPGSLRDTIAGASAGDTIQFSYTLFVPRIVLTSGELVINKDLTISSGRFLIDGHKTSRVFNITAGTVVLSGLTISNSFSSGDGGGLYNSGNLMLQNCMFTMNSAQANGGGLFNQGAVTITNCTFVVNNANNYGGGIGNISSLAVNNSTLYGNVAYANGGGIGSFGTTTINNSTLYGNSAQNAGGGIMTANSLILNHTTISGNAASAGGGLAIPFGSVQLQNTLVAGNSAGNSYPDVSLAFNSQLTSQGFNLIGITDGSSGWLATDRTGTSGSPLNPVLGSLQNNGGPTLTVAPLPGSPALDAATTAGLTTDQIGQSRRFDNFLIANVNGGDGSDIGAYEVQGPIITSQPQPANQFVAAGQNITYSVSAADGGTMSYQWRKDGVNISGATGSSLSLNTVQPTVSGSYRVVISDSSGGSAESDPASLIVGFTLARGVNGSGSVVANPDQSLYTNNQVVSLTALPAVGSVFSRWTGDASGTANPLNVTMTASKSVTGNFSSATRTNHVTNLNDTGPGSLRAAFAASVSGNTIDFPGLTGTILLTSGELAINTDLTIIGTGQTNLIISGKGPGSSFRVFNISPGVNAVISDLTIANGYINDAPGGGIYNAGTLTLENCGLAANVVSEFSGGQIYGGAIYNNGGRLSVNNCNLTGNYALSYASHGSVAAGGAIYNDAGSVSLRNSAFAGNLVASTQNAPGYGGSLYNGGGTLSVNNCTLATNSVKNLVSQSVCYGGAIFNAGTFTISNSTIAGNSTYGSSSGTIGGGIYQSAGGATIQNSILAGNFSSLGLDVYGVISSQGFNLISQTNGSRGWTATDLVGSATTALNPMLGTLTNNGGPTLTMALLAGSPAIDAGYSGGLKTDQRGAPRPVDSPAALNAAGGDGSDIGAYETGLTLRLNIFGAGVVLKNPDQPAYDHNEKVTLTAIPAAGWSFSGWSADASGSANPVTITMTDDRFVTANFVSGGSACAPAAAGLVGWWPGAGTGNDVVGLNNGVLEGTTFGQGRVGQAFSFDGAGADVLLPASAELGFRTQFTIEAWICPLDVNNYRQIFSAFRDAPVRDWHYQIGLAPGGALRMDVSGDNVTYDYLASAGGWLVPNTWSHVAATFSSGSMRLYVNGTLVASKQSTVKTIYGSTFTSVLIGSTPQGNQRFVGLVDEMSAYNRALAPSEIQGIATAGSAGKCMAPVCITGINKSGTNVSLYWLAQRCVSYRAQYKTDLNPATPWIDLNGDVPATSATASKTDNPSVGTAQRFYRVEMLR